MRSDPNRAQQENNKAKTWLAAKLKRCPEYAQLRKLQTRKQQLHAKVELHMRIAEKADKELLRITDEYQKLAKKCRGK
jgi:hypothetical protein